MVEPVAAPTTAEELRGRILRGYEQLSKRLQQIARYVLDEPNDIAVETLAVIASRCGVQPSAIVRFAQSFGFEGATQMQRLFRHDLLSANPGMGYSERARQLSVDAGGPGRLLKEFVLGNVTALNNLVQTVSEDDLQRAVSLISEAETVYVSGFRRSFPVASYLAYSLLQAGKRTLFIDGVGGLANQQIDRIGPRDLLIAVSYHPYAEETIAMVAAANAHGARVLAMSDSLVSPIAKPAQLVLQVRESDVRSFRSLSASMCLAQALVITHAVSRARRTSA